MEAYIEKYLIVAGHVTKV